MAVEVGEVLTNVDVGLPLWQAGCTYETRDGGTARIYATDGGGVYPIHGAVYGDGIWLSASWTASGLHYDGELGGMDLVKHGKQYIELTDSVREKLGMEVANED